MRQEEHMIRNKAREKEISKAALEYANEEIIAAPYDAFLAGAQWADQHPVNYDGKAMLYVNNRSHENGYKEAVDKACRWLLEWEIHQGEDIEIVEQFRKAMEGE